MRQTDEDRAVGAGLAAVRRRRGVSLDELAAATGLTVSGYRRLESGDTRLTLPRLRQAARAMSLQPWELLRELGE